jgi:hypothetical protein
MAFWRGTASNLVTSDPFFQQKMHTFTTSFPHTWRFECDGVNVLFGSESDMSRTELGKNAECLYERFSFIFPFIELLDDMNMVGPQHTAKFGPPLSDAGGRGGLATSVPRNDPMFYRLKRNDPCPCGSGRKFKKCHGA